MSNAKEASESAGARRAAKHMGRLRKTMHEQMRRKPAMDHSMAGFGQMPKKDKQSAVGLLLQPLPLERVSYGLVAAVGEHATQYRNAKVLADHASRTIAHKDARGTRMEGVKVP
jgi:hypothetical protein